MHGMNGDEFFIEVNGYQFLTILSNEHDYNWLIIEIKARCKGKSWKITDPCLLTWELDALINWLRKILEGQETAREIKFSEPNLWFSLEDRQKDLIRLRVYFESEVRPDWAGIREIPPGQFWVQIDCTPSELSQWIHELTEQSLRFPPRTGLAQQANRFSFSVDLRG